MSETTTPPNIPDAPPSESLEDTTTPTPKMDSIHPEQWRSSRIQLVNWGTFDNYHDIPVPRKGIVIGGESGSGKSTILDAISAVLMSKGKVRYNAAASGSESGDRDRSEVSYVRGAYAKEAATASADIRTQHLREQAVRAGIAVTFSNGKGQSRTIARIFRIESGHYDKASLKDSFMFVPEPLNLVEALDSVTDRDYIKRLKKAFPMAQFSATSSGFDPIIRRQLGIRTEIAQQLLHKSVAAKNLSSLDGLMRDYMLDTPTTFETAENAVTQFNELRQAHIDVQNARDQIALLQPLRKAQSDRAEAIENIAHFSQLQQFLPKFELQIRLDDNQRKLAQLTAELNRTSEEMLAAQSQAEKLQEAVNSARMEKDSTVGNTQGILEAEKKIAYQNLQRINTQLQRIQPGLAALGVKTPQTPTELAAITTQAARELHGLAQHRTELIQQEVNLKGELQQAAAQTKEIELEIASLASRTSLIPRQLIELRQELSQSLGKPAASLPFVGELLDVTDQQWRPAIEKLLHSYGLTMLVPDELGQKVAKWVNATRLTDSRGRGQRLVYERINPNIPEPSQKLVENSVLTKLDLKEGLMRSWVAGQLARRFNYACVENASQLINFEQAITVAGLIKSNRRHDKDDRRLPGDRSTWVLGTSNQHRIEDLKLEHDNLKAKLAATNQELKALTEQHQGIDRANMDLTPLLDIVWDTIDVNSATKEIADIEDRLARLLEENPNWAALTQRLEFLESELKEANQRFINANGQKAVKESQLAQLQAIILADQQSLGEEQLDETVIKELYGYCAQYSRSLQSDNIRGIVDKVRITLQASAENYAAAKNRLETQIGRIMTNYTLKWEQYAANMVPELDGLPDFLDRLTQLENDNLPKFEVKFRELLANQSQKFVATLRAEILDSFDQVRARINPINESLSLTPYNTEKGHYLQLSPLKSQNLEVRDFLKELTSISEGSLNTELEDETQAEKRFNRLAKLIRRFDSQDAVDRSWRNMVLDTRRHVTFQAIERDATGVQRDVYDGAAGRSGGQTQKLVTFCLAAALRYQLADPGAELPRYGTIVLDEAFDKADWKYTTDALKVFETFGFHLVLASPFKILQVVEPFVGGVAKIDIDNSHRSQVSIIEYSQKTDEDTTAPATDAATPGQAAATPATGIEITASESAFIGGDTALVDETNNDSGGSLW